MVFLYFPKNLIDEYSCPMSLLNFVLFGEVRQRILKKNVFIYIKLNEGSLIQFKSND